MTTSMYGSTITCVHDRDDGSEATFIAIGKIEGMSWEHMGSLYGCMAPFCHWL